MEIVRPKPQVFLKANGGNPWTGTLDDAVVQQFLFNAAIEGEAQILRWIDSGDLAPDAAFAQVYLDPTNPRDQTTIKDRVFAFVIHGDSQKALSLVPNAVAKADATDRHGGRRNGELVERANFCLGIGDFAWGDSATYYGAISAGSGLEPWQDHDLSQLELETTMRAVHNARTAWLEERRKIGSHGWLNEANVPYVAYEIQKSSIGDWLPFNPS